MAMRLSRVKTVAKRAGANLLRDTVGARIPPGNVHCRITNKNEVARTPYCLGPLQITDQLRTRVPAPQSTEASKSIISKVSADATDSKGLVDRLI